MGVKLGALDISKFYVGSQEVDKIYLGTNMVYQKIQFPPVPYVEWSGNVTLNINGSLPISPYTETFGQVGTTTMEVDTYDYGTITCIKQSDGTFSGSVFPLGTPVNGQYFVQFTMKFSTTNGSFKLLETWFYEGSSYPNIDFMDSNWGVWMSEIRTVAW